MKKVAVEISELTRRTAMVVIEVPDDFDEHDVVEQHSLFNMAQDIGDDLYWVDDNEYYESGSSQIVENFNKESSAKYKLVSDEAGDSLERVVTDPCPKCGKQIVGKTMQEGGGVKCSAKDCDYWFCY